MGFYPPIYHSELTVNLALDHEITKIYKTIKAKAIKAFKAIKTIKAT